MQVLMQPPLPQGSSLSRPAALRSPASLQHSRDGGAAGITQLAEV